MAPGAFHSDGEAEAVDRGVIADRAQGVHLVGRDVDEVALGDLPVLAVDRHDPLAVHHVIELVGRVGVRVDQASTRDLELVDQLQEATVGDVLELAGLDHPPDRNGAVVLDDRRLGLNAAHVHPEGLPSFLD